MPTAPARLCPGPGCRNRQPCAEHIKTPWNHDGLNAHARGYGRAWRARRLEILARDGYLCQACRRRGVATLATTVDHILNKARGGTDDASNLEALCETCQQRKAGREGQRARG